MEFENHLRTSSGIHTIIIEIKEFMEMILEKKDALKKTKQNDSWWIGHRHSEFVLINWHSLMRYSTRNEKQMRGVLEIGAELQSPPFLWPQETFLNIVQPKAHRCHHAIDEESIFRSSFSSHFCWVLSLLELYYTKY